MRPATIGLIAVLVLFGCKRPDPKRMPVSESEPAAAKSALAQPKPSPASTTEEPPTLEPEDVRNAGPEAARANKLCASGQYRAAGKLIKEHSIRESQAPDCVSAAAKLEAEFDAKCGTLASLDDKRCDSLADDVDAINMAFPIE